MSENWKDYQPHGNRATAEPATNKSGLETLKEKITDLSNNLTTEADSWIILKLADIANSLIQLGKIFNFASRSISWASFFGKNEQSDIQSIRNNVVDLFGKGFSKINPDSYKDAAHLFFMLTESLKPTEKKKAFHDLIAKIPNNAYAIRAVLDIEKSENHKTTTQNNSLRH
jgi:hypothetical protein